MIHAHHTKSLRSLVHKARRTPGTRLWLTPLVLAWALVGAQGLWAQGAKPTDYDVKAVYLYNFGRFVEWPASSGAKSDSFSVCILGRDPFGPTLDATLAGEAIGGRRVTAKRISRPPEADGCQIVFLSASEDSQLKNILQALDKEAVLTVSDMPLFSQRGGMIQFVVEGDRVRFEVNLSAVQRAGLTLSSELLKVATTVRKNPSQGD